MNQSVSINNIIISKLCFNLIGAIEVPHSSVLVTKCSILTLFSSVLLGTAFYAQVLCYKKVLVILSVIHRNKRTIKSNSKHDNAIKDSQHNIVFTIGYCASIVIDKSKIRG